MIPVKLVEDFAPRLTFLDEFASRCPITPNFFPSTPTSARWESDSLCCNCAYCCQDECTQEHPSSNMSILALKGRCLAMCLYSNSVVLESKKRSFFFWNAWVGKSEHSRLLRKAKLVATKRRYSALRSTTFRALLSVTSVLRNQRQKGRMMEKRSYLFLTTRIVQVWRDFITTKSRVIDDLDGSVKECKQDPHKNQDSPRQLSSCISKYHLKKFRIGAGTLKSIPMKILLMYGASLSRILRAWAEFSWQHRFEISTRVQSQQRSFLNCFMRAWIDAHNQRETVIFTQQIRRLKDLKFAVISQWRYVCKEGWKSLVYDLFEQNPLLQLDDEYSLPMAESIPDMFERSLITLGQTQFRITKKALDSWKEELNRIFSIKMMINNARGKQARKVLDVWHKFVKSRSEKRQVVPLMAYSAQNLRFAWRKWRTSVSDDFTVLNGKQLAKQAQKRLDKLQRAQFRKWKSKVILSHFYSQRAMPYGVFSLLKRSHDRIQHEFFHSWLFCMLEVQNIMFQSSQTSMNILKSLARQDWKILLRAFQTLRSNAAVTVRRRNMEWKLKQRVAMIRIRFAVFVWSQHRVRSKSYQQISFKILKVHEVGIYTRTLNSWFLSVLNCREIKIVILKRTMTSRKVLVTICFSAWMSRNKKKSLLVRKMSKLIVCGRRALILKCIGNFQEHTFLTKKTKQLQDRIKALGRRNLLVQTFRVIFQQSKIRTTYLVWTHERLKNKLTLLSLLVQWQFFTSRSLAIIEDKARKYHYHPHLFVRSAQIDYDTRARNFEIWSRATQKHRKLSAADKFQMIKQRNRILLHFLKVWQVMWLFSLRFRGAFYNLEGQIQFRLRNQIIIKWRKWVLKSHNIKLFISQRTAMVSHRISCRAWITWILKTTASAEIFHHADVLCSQKQQAAVFHAWISWMMHTYSAVEAREQLKEALNKKQMIVPITKRADEKYLQPTTLVHPGSALETFISLSGSAQVDDFNATHRCMLLDNLSQRQMRQLLTRSMVEWHSVASARSSCQPLPRKSSSSFIVSC
jgi:hypothetical protein